jgi:hypothetical protein
MKVDGYGLLALHGPSTAEVAGVVTAFRHSASQHRSIHLTADTARALVARVASAVR